MIYGIGTDIVSVARIRKNLDRYGLRFAQRILSDEELAGFSHSRSPAHFVAKRFAAKEAAAKALGTGFSRGIGPRQISVSRQRGQRPMLRFDGAAGELVRSRGMTGAHLSLTDEDEHAVAFVVLEVA